MQTVCDTPAAVKAPRAAFWITRPFDLPTGGRMGFFGVRVGKVTDYYRATLTEADDMAQRWLVAKEQADGTYAEPYSVCLPSAGVFGGPVCSCKGWSYGGKCRHGSALRALLSQCGK
jgi:hypothetical protein